ncbi:MAG TPA: dihydroorotase family protein [Candidatus Dormibacteraeota bacterium]
MSRLRLPGAIDAHVHGRDPGFPDKEDFGSLTAAARAGGVTTVLDMPNNVPAPWSGELLAAKAAAVEPRARVDFGLWGLLRSSSTEAQVRELAAAGAIGFKAYLGYSYRPSLGTVTYGLDPGDEPPPSYDTLDRLGPALAEAGLPVAVHAEDPEELLAAARPVATYADLLASRPAEAEAVAIRRCAGVARRHGFHLHVVHLASAAGVEAVRAARAAGTRMSVEVTPNHLWLAADDYERVGPFMKMFPLVRTEEDRSALRSALLAGEIDTIGTDHAPHTGFDKDRPLAEAHAGSPGVQWLYVAAFEFARRFGGDPLLAVKWVADNPARIFGLAPNGEVEVDDAAVTRVGEGALSRQPRSALDGLEFGFRVVAVHAPERGRWVRPAVRPA